MSAENIIVDANVAFKSLCKRRGNLRQRLAPSSSLTVYCPRYLFVELFKHKERLARASGLSEADLSEALYVLISQLELVNEANIPIGTWVEAYRLCKNIDENDVAYVALTLHLNGRFWTEDIELKTALRGKGFDQFFELQ